MKKMRKTIKKKKGNEGKQAAAAFESEGGSKRGSEEGVFTESMIKRKGDGGSARYENALLVVGLPGIGLVSKMAVDHLTRLLHAPRIASIYSPHFPNQVLSMKTGRLHTFSMRVYHAKIGSRDVLFVRGDLQPLTVEGQYEVSGKILAFARELGATEVIAMAGYSVAKRSEKPAVYCASTSKKFLKKFEALGARKTAGVVPVVGMAGLIPGLAPAFGMRGICLLVETAGNAIDPKGAKALLELLGKFFGKHFDSKELESRARKAEKLLRKLEAQAARSQQKMLPAPLAAEPEAIKRDSLNYIR